MVYNRGWADETQTQITKKGTQAKQAQASHAGSNHRKQTPSRSYGELRPRVRAKITAEAAGIHWRRGVQVGSGCLTDIEPRCQQWSCPASMHSDMSPIYPVRSDRRTTEWLAGIRALAVSSCERCIPNVRWIATVCRRGDTYFERECDGVRVLAVDPLLGTDGGILRQGVGIEILLEEIRFAGHCHGNDLAQTVVVHPIELGHFAGGHVAASLGHQANASLRFCRLKCVDVVHERRLGRHLAGEGSLKKLYITVSLQTHLKVPNNRVTLAAEVDQVRVGIVQWEHDAIGRVQLHHDDGLVESVWGTQRVLALGASVEARREDQTMTQENGSCGLRAFVAHGLALQVAGARVVDADLLVLAGGDQLGAVPVEASAVHDVRMRGDVHEDLASTHVPDDHLNKVLD